MVDSHRSVSGPFYFIPTDSAMACLSSKHDCQFDKKKFTIFRPLDVEQRDETEDRGRKIGHVVHAHCWTLFGHVLETEFTASRLAELAAASQMYWFRATKLDHRQIRSLWPIGVDIGPAQSPIYLPGIRDIIDRFQVLSFTTPGVSSTRFSTLPMDVAVLIAEMVCPLEYDLDDVKDTENLVSISQWRLPRSFWCLRLDENILFELKELKGSKALLDWQLLRLALMRLVADESSYISKGLKLRARAMERMYGIKKMYLTNGKCYS